jgi:hypothetical protein
VQVDLSPARNIDVRPVCNNYVMDLKKRRGAPKAKAELPQSMSKTTLFDKNKEYLASGEKKESLVNNKSMSNLHEFSKI